MRGLKICLWITGILCLLSVFGMFLPIATWESIAKCFGVESLDLPESPLVEYAVRLMSATYVGVGLFFVILALAPMKYGIMVPFAAVTMLILGIFCGITGLATAMPILWFMGDTLGCIVLGVLILVFWRKAKQSARP
jgi:hypothetical protein